MTKEVYVLNPKAWHMKLMTWIWGFNQYDFSHMCNYFWLSVLNVIIFLPFCLFKLSFFLFKGLISVFSSVWNKYENYCFLKEEEWHKKQWELIQRQTSNGDYNIIDQLSKRYLKNYNSKRSTRLSKKDREMLNIVKSDDFLNRRFWDTFYKNQNKVDKRKENQVVERKKKVAKAAIYTKKFLKVLAIIAIAGLTYLFYKFISFLTTLNWVEIFHNVIIIFVIILALVIMAFILYFTVKAIKFLICRYGTYCIPCDERRQKLGNFFAITRKSIAYPFVKLWVGIIFFLIDIMIELKRNHCPAIEWKQDDQSE